jgi:alpha-glucosidase
MADFGYDISDYRAVDPLFGTLADFDRLLAAAHQRGLRVMIDQVLSHTSSDHTWFRESRQNRSNPRADWYVWADPKADGSPPNNWLSLFGGVAWQWEPRRSQYYLHNFLTEQPDLNFHNPEVRRQTLANIQFWLDRGVDGVRLDAINFCFHDALLRDNPPKPSGQRQIGGVSVDNPYAYQRHLYNNTRPETLPFLETLRQLLDRYPGSVALGEISAEDAIVTMAEYTAPGRLHMAYSFELLGSNGSPRHIRATVEALQRAGESLWPCWAISNHDVERVVSRWGSGSASNALALQLSALVASLRGSVCVYQGEELGLTEAQVPYEQLRDPYGITFWPNFKGRDGCRTPMPWEDASYAGFSSQAPWLPVAAEHRAHSVATQERDPDSCLNGFRRFMAWRASQPTLLTGELEFVASTDECLAFRRRSSAADLLVAFNLSPREVLLPLPEVDSARVLSGHGLPPGRLDRAGVLLPAHGAIFASLK